MCRYSPSVGEAPVCKGAPTLFIQLEYCHKGVLRHFYAAELPHAFFAFFLFYPWSKKVYEDGGTTIYSSLTYELIIWRTIGGKDNIEFYLFPENLKNHVV